MTCINYEIHDWTGKVLFGGQPFPSFQDGWTFIYENVPTEGDEHTYDDYFVYPVKAEVTARLEYLRGQIRAECISYGEIADLVDLADYIEPGDAELAQWAGIPEAEFGAR